MNIDTLTMEPQAARDLLERYRSGLRRRKDEEWEAAALALEEMRDGTHLIDVAQALRNQDLVPDDYRPTLAIARADRKEVRFQWSGQTVLQYDARSWNASAPSTTLDLRFSWDGRVEWKERRVGYAMVPMIPPDADVAASKLREHYVLWEVEEGGWADTREGADMDPDPFLLRPILGWLCAIVHEWDLTPIERAIAEAVRR